MYPKICLTTLSCLLAGTVLAQQLDLVPADRRAERITAAQALEHPYFASLHDAADEPFSPGVFDSSFEDFQLDARGWFGLVCQEISAFRSRTDIPK